MPLDLENAPFGIKEYAASLANLTNEQLFERIAMWPDRDTKTFMEPMIVEALAWTLRCEIEELRHRIVAWIAVEPVVLLPYSGLQATCPMCKANGKGEVKTWYHEAPEPESICWGRLEEGRRHLHRGCKKCTYEWLEACAT
jgi:hypothetical protein